MASWQPTVVCCAVVFAMQGKATHEAVNAAHPLPRKTYVVVMTDGDDTGSKHTLAECELLVGHLNRLRDFHVRACVVFSCRGDVRVHVRGRVHAYRAPYVCVLGTVCACTRAHPLHFRGAQIIFAGVDLSMGSPGRRALQQLARIGDRDVECVLP
jgi:hypothetical protein